MPEPHPPHAGELVSADAVRAPRGGRATGILPSHLYKAAGLLFLLLAVLHYLDRVVEVLLLAYAAVVLAVLFNALVQKLPLSRKWVTIGLGLIVVGTLVSVLWLGVPLLMAQVRDLVSRGPEFVARMHLIERWIEARTGLQVQLMGPRFETLVRSVFLGGGASGNFLARAQGAMGMLLIPLLILFGALYAVGSPNKQLLSPLLRAVPRERRPAFTRIFQLLGDRILGWGKGVLISMLAVGLLSLLLYSLIGVPNALLLALIAGLTEGIPLIGPWVGGGIATAAAAVDDPSKGVWTAAAAVLIQQIEGNLIMPFAMSRAAEVHPFVTLFALLLFGSLFGFLGVVLSIPIVLLVATLVEVLWIERTIDTDRDTITPIVDE